MAAPAKLATITKGRFSPRGGERETPIVKVAAEKQIVYGVVLDPYIVDAHDDWIPPAEVEKTAHWYLADYRAMKIEHEKRANAIPVESWLVPYPSPEDYRKAMALEPHRVWRMKFGTDYIHSGAWVLGTLIVDAETWASVVSGELGAFSIGAWGTREQMDKLPMPVVEVLTIEAPTP